MDGFAARVHAFVRSVPRGRVVTYSDVAWAVGCPGGARAVGRVMAATADGSVPCHRVVRADGTVAGAVLARTLRKEGVAIGPGGRVARFDALRWP